MICDDCKVGGDFNSWGNYDKADKSHDLCKGDCTCQHLTGAGWFVKAGQKPSTIRLQSP